MSKRLHTLLTKQQRESWKDIVTRDESWYYLHTDHEHRWLQPDQPVPERARQTIQSETVMLTIVWNHYGFHIIDALPNGCKFNGSYFLIHILEPFTIDAKLCVIRARKN
jgi:hypothetical protein